MVERKRVGETEDGVRERVGEKSKESGEKGIGGERATDRTRVG